MLRLDGGIWQCMEQRRKRLSRRRLIRRRLNRRSLNRRSLNHLRRNQQRKQHRQNHNFFHQHQPEHPHQQSNNPLLLQRHVHPHLQFHPAASSPRPSPTHSASQRPPRPASSPSRTNTTAAFQRPVRHLLRTLVVSQKARPRSPHWQSLCVGFLISQSMRYPCLFAKFWLE
jgi:hypothetical protein